MVANVPPRALTPALWSQPSNFKATGNFSFIALKLGDGSSVLSCTSSIQKSCLVFTVIYLKALPINFPLLPSFIGSTPYFSQRFTKTEEKSKYSEHKAYA